MLRQDDLAFVQLAIVVMTHNHSQVAHLQAIHNRSAVLRRHHLSTRILSVDHQKQGLWSTWELRTFSLHCFSIINISSSTTSTWSDLEEVTNKPRQNKRSEYFYLSYILSTTANFPTISCVVFLNHMANTLVCDIIRSQPRPSYALSHRFCFRRSWQDKPLDDHVLQRSPCIREVPEMNTTQIRKNM